MKRMLCWAGVLAAIALGVSKAEAGSTLGVSWLVHAACSFYTPGSLSGNAAYRIQHDDSYVSGGVTITDCVSSSNNQSGVYFDAVLVESLYPSTHYNSKNCYVKNISGPITVTIFAEDKADGGSLAHVAGQWLGILDDAFSHDIAYQNQGSWAGAPPSFSYAPRNVLSNSTDQFLFNAGW